MLQLLLYLWDMCWLVFPLVVARMTSYHFDMCVHLFHSTAHTLLCNLWFGGNFSTAKKWYCGRCILMTINQMIVFLCPTSIPSWFVWWWFAALCSDNWQKQKPCIFSASGNTHWIEMCHCVSTPGGWRYNTLVSCVIQSHTSVGCVKWYDITSSIVLHFFNDGEKLYLLVFADPS